MRVFGKTEAEIDVLEDRKIDPALVVPSPIGGLRRKERLVGLLAKPGNPPSVYVVADMSTMSMLANVAER